ncbi:MAG: cyclic nucleotide-binding domain-containing protein [Betaproteobacteria bacterium]|jgi:hemerythrin|nr:cyclic nucleotide-binding domain-containing protein [Betaproteobacteria bacterium]
MSAIRKINVTTGISWIEIADAGLRLLCGCPADVVKHLARRGLILPVEVGGVACESGPNAILLSDLAIQNGQACNRAEFPVLQMLYLQGMLVPDHPNNTGERPQLIGSHRQVETQLAYLFRGNYGLASHEELVEAGVPEAQAETIMRMKLAFAYGRIRPTEELVEPLVVEHEPLELRGGVRLRRLRTNLFEIGYRGETVEVDLNLAPGEHYPSPYTLGHYLLEPDYFAVAHTGEGDGWDMNRPAMGCILFFQGRVYLVDAGPNVEFALSAVGIGVNEIDGIFQTHCHDDHLVGLTSLIAGDRRIAYYAVPMVRASAFKKLSAVMQLPEREFGRLFDVRDLMPDSWNDIAGLEVKPILSPHPVETTILYFRALWEGGYRVYGHLADIASERVMNELLAPDDAPYGISAALREHSLAAYRMRADVKKIDIGGGLIHGDAQDFRGDSSGKLILAHTARRLTEEERAIGSGASFGTVDVLIQGSSDIFRRRAYEYLRGYFPDVPKHRIRHLLNCAHVVIDPEVLLLHEGERVSDVYLVLSGSVERLRPGVAGASLLSAGSILGEAPALLDMPAAESYRALGFVRALRVPRDLYVDFVTRSALYRHAVQAHEKREFLRSVPLFADGVSGVTLNRLVQAAEPRSLERGARLPPPAETLFVLEAGAAQLSTAVGYQEALGVGSHFGAVTLAGVPIDGAGVEVLDAVSAYSLPLEAIVELPVVRWKLLETHRRRYIDR